MIISLKSLVAGMVGAIAVPFLCAAGFAEDLNPKVTTSDTMTSEELSAQSEQHKFYGSPAERAHDALIITEVKAALAADGIADGYPITVGAAHGVVTLTGILGSQQDIAHAIDVARTADGVKNVENRLTMRRNQAASNRY
jgi:osmotically-inducible protein OsmY